MNLPKPWPRRPPADATCDAMVGSSVDFTGKPVVIRCKEPATETCWWGHEAWLCADHAESLAKKGRVVRNPRVRR